MFFYALRFYSSVGYINVCVHDLSMPMYYNTIYIMYIDVYAMNVNAPNKRTNAEMVNCFGVILPSLDRMNIYEYEFEQLWT